MSSPTTPPPPVPYAALTSRTPVRCPGLTLELPQRRCVRSVGGCRGDHTASPAYAEAIWCGEGWSVSGGCGWPAGHPGPHLTSADAEAVRRQLAEGVPSAVARQVPVRCGSRQLVEGRAAQCRLEDGHLGDHVCGGRLTAPVLIDWCCAEVPTHVVDAAPELCPLPRNHWGPCLLRDEALAEAAARRAARRAAEPGDLSVDRRRAAIAADWARVEPLEVTAYAGVLVDGAGDVVAVFTDAAVADRVAAAVRDAGVASGLFGRLLTEHRDVMLGLLEALELTDLERGLVGDVS